ncbi:exosortase C-terminal domain/associated protein EpsI [Erythrobacter sp. SD-21]|uniref:exosortase C-terminal domain/associated protein EpsI n=1 Tax=Erythrobacter sp. SD-21 TaxID=161528 RepID=UPI000153F3A6|nr:exosortase C-terminal domain/associated protein EpsI [Erythrobacter sp. SD-21]EDL49327.1 hypothetical protein ED21_21644 [Erythrobacter sp. SD-21]
MMLDRRSAIFAGLCATGFAAAEALRPRTILKFAPTETTLEDTVPKQFAGWRSQFDPSLVVAPSENSLTARLYDDLLMRRYIHSETGLEVFLLAAYGGTQTDDLQLHRPESCYPAVGLPITRRDETIFTYDGREIPSVSLLSELPGRIEEIFYWSRIGDKFPTTASEQRDDKLSFAFEGRIPDGMLVRFSTVRRAEHEAYSDLEAFARTLLTSMTEQQRASFIA